MSRQRCPIYILAAGTCKYVTLGGKMDFSDMIENLEMEKLP